MINALLYINYNNVGNACLNLRPVTRAKSWGYYILTEKILFDSQKLHF